jgi:hypothetical protein
MGNMLAGLVAILSSIFGLNDNTGVPAELIADLQVEQAKDNKQVAQLEAQKANLAYQQALTQQKIVDAKRK